MEIKVIVDQITLDTVVGNAVGYDEDGYEEGAVPVTVADRVAELVRDEVVKRPEYAALANRVTDIRAEEIRAAVKPLIREALERPIRRTNYYGEATGTETTLSELIMTEAKNVFTEVKDSYRSNKPFITEVVAAEVKKAFQADIQEQVQKARAAIAAQLGASLSGEVVKTALKALQGGK